MSARRCVSTVAGASGQMTNNSQFMVLSENPQQDDALIYRLQWDLACLAHPLDEIAQRYRFQDKQELKDYLRHHPSIVKEGAEVARPLQQRRSHRAAGAPVKFMQVTEHLIMPMAQLVKDTNTPIAARVDAFKQIQRGAGVDGAPPPALKGGGGGGTAFSLTINFAGGRRPEVIEGTTVVDGSIPNPAIAGLSLTTGSDDDPGVGGRGMSTRRAPPLRHARGRSQVRVGKYEARPRPTAGRARAVGGANGK